MTELWLKFTDESGARRKIAVNAEVFFIGRHSENDLSIPNGKLSRQHLKIERFGDVFVTADLNSSNGTTVNGAPASTPVKLKNGDRLNLGGGLEIEIELSSAERNDFFFEDFAENDFEASQSEPEKPAETDAPAPPQNVPKQTAANAAANKSSFPTSVFWIAPILGILILIFVGGLFLAFSKKSANKTEQPDDDFVYSTNSAPR